MADLAPATGALLQTIIDSTHDIWSEGLTPEAYARYYAAQVATPWGGRRLERLALVEGANVVASAKVYSFDAGLDGQAIHVAGIGAVFTEPAYRGRGHGRVMVERVLQRAAGAGADLALLFSEIGPDYYERLGFRPIPAVTQALRIVEPARAGAPAMLVRFGEDRDLADLVEMGRVRAQPFRFHLTRDRDLVQYAIAKKRVLAGLGPPGLREVRFFVAEEGASAVAYVVITVRREGSSTAWMVEECGDRDPAGARVGAILQTLVARDAAEARPAISAWLPHGFRPQQLVVTDERLDPSEARPVMMVRPLRDRARAAGTLVANDVCFWHADAF